VTKTTADDYWPNEFFSELTALFTGDRGDELKSERLAEMYERAAAEITSPAIANPQRALAEELGQRAAFETRLAARWGRGLDLADLAIQESLECGRWVNSLLRPGAAARQDQKFEALIRLHGKAAMTAQEVLVLLRSGFSSGALARWRTLHEVWVVFLVLADGDERLSRRYLVHEVVESLKAQKEYEETWEALGQEPPGWTATDREETRSSLSDEFGSAFLKDYGWASPLFNDQAPKFRQLQETVDLGHWRGYYRMASHGTHANPKGVSWNIQAMQTVETVWAGPSNAGLVDPAQCTLIALANLTVGLLSYAVREMAASDDEILHQSIALVRQQSILILMDRAIDSFAETDAQQKTEEEEIQVLIRSAAEALRRQSSMTSAQLSIELEMDPETLEEALRAAVERQELVGETTYRLEEDGLDEQDA